MIPDVLCWLHTLLTTWLWVSPFAKPQFQNLEEVAGLYAAVRWFSFVEKLRESFCNWSSLVTLKLCSAWNYNTWAFKQGLMAIKAERQEIFQTSLYFDKMAALKDEELVICWNFTENQFRDLLNSTKAWFNLDRDYHKSKVFLVAELAPTSSTIATIHPNQAR